MSRKAVVEQVVLWSLGDAKLTIAGLLKAIHAAYSDIKHVAFIKTYDQNYFTVWVRYHDRQSDTFKFVRDNLSEYNG